MQSQCINCISLLPASNALCASLMAAMLINHLALTTRYYRKKPGLRIMNTVADCELMVYNACYLPIMTLVMT